MRHNAPNLSNEYFIFPWPGILLLIKLSRHKPVSHLGYRSHHHCYHPHYFKIITIIKEIYVMLCYVLNEDDTFPFFF